MPSELILVAVLFVLTLALGLWQQVEIIRQQAAEARLQQAPASRAGRGQATPRPALVQVDTASHPLEVPHPLRADGEVDPGRVTITRAEYELLRAAGELVKELAAQRRREERALERARGANG